MEILNPQLTAPNLLGDFESMVQQMRDNLSLLESRVATRTRDLQIAAEVSRQIATILDLDQLLPEVVDLVKQNFELYHAHVYLLDSEGRNLVLAAGAGEPGRLMLERGHSIPLSREQSLVARAARSRQGVVINDVTREMGFMPNPLLPDTRSEMALPMVIADTLIGVLDVQSDMPDRFDENDVQVQTSLAAQVALAVQNARTYLAQKAARQESEILYAASRKIPAATTPLEQLQAVSDYAFQLGAKTSTLLYVDLDESGKPEWLSLIVTSDRDGSIRTSSGFRYYLPDYDFTRIWLAHPEEATLIPDVYDSELIDTGVRSAFEQSGVRASALLPLTVQGRWIGLIIIAWTEPRHFDEREHQIFSTLAQQIAPAAESIRLLQDTRQQRERAELLASINAALSDAKTPDDILLALAPGMEYFGTLNGALGYLDVDSEGIPIATTIASSWTDGKIDQSSPMRDQRFLLEHFPISKLWIQNPEEPLYIADIMSDPRTEGDFRAMLAGTGMVSMSLIPLYGNGQWQGTLTLFWNTAHMFSRDEQEFYNSVGHTLASVVATRRAADEVVRSERQYRQILDAIKDMVLVKGPQSRIVWANRAFLDHYGMNNEALQGMIDAPFQEPDRTQQYIIDDEKVFTSGQVLAIPEEVVARHDGVERIFSTVKSPIYNDQGEVILTVGVSRDITEQKLAEQARQALFETSNALNHAQTPEALMEAISQYGKLNGAIGAALAYFDNDEDGAPLWVETVAEWRADGAHTFLGSRIHVPSSPLAQVWITNHEEPLFIEDIATTDLLTEQSRHLFLSAARSLVFIPLYMQDRWVGLATAVWQDPQVFTELDKQTYKAVAQQATPAVDAVRAAETVRRRALELETVARVSTEVSTTLDVQALLPRVAELTKTSFGLYHAHIYLLDETGTTLKLAAGAGEPGRQMLEHGHSIPLNREQSLVARAARTQQGVVINDVTREDGFMPNPLLPETRSEMALPMVVGDTLIGVLDVQSEIADRFSEDDVRVQLTLASQIAVAVQNASTFAQVEQAQREIEHIFNSSMDMIGSMNFQGIFTRLNPAWEATFGWTSEELMSTLLTEFIHPEDVEMTSQVGQAILSGQPVVDYSLRFRCKDGSYKWVSWRATPEVASGSVHFIARDITEQRQAEEDRQILLETANALNSAQTPDALMNAISQYARSRGASATALTYFEIAGDGQPLWGETVADWREDGGQVFLGSRIYLPEMEIGRVWTADHENPVLIEDVATTNLFSETVRSMLLPKSRSVAFIPLYVQNRWIGVAGAVWPDPQVFTERDRQMYMSIAQQAAPVVDAVRAAETVRRRALELETVARVSAEVSASLDVQALLPSVVELTKASFGLYHAHIYLLDETGRTLKLAAGAGEPGRIMQERGHSIPVSREHSLVARAARTRESITVNDVTRDISFLPNPLLPDTRSEMALPMIVGDTLIGVLDVQSNIPDRFTEDDMRVQETLASQIAVAVQNASAFSQIAEQAERERHTAERLREVDRLKSQFMANMSHELRTPLNSIIGYSEILLDGDDGEIQPDALEDIQIIHSSGQYLLTIINDILDLAKIEAGQMRMDIRKVNFANAIDDVVHAAQVLVKDKPVKLELIRDREAPIVAADPVRLRQIVMNLVSNAAKFTEEGTVIVTYGRANEDFAYVSVQDTGIGISSEDLGLIFDQFRQVDGSSTRRAGGTGLGLTITRYLVEMHGGEIKVESEPGAGSIFTVTIPVDTSEEGAE